ncbi:MAG TPA: hypothetical protein VMC06_01520 [Opitutaceae bacterium]|nr:hypothetical protein [Opitutaceae bacterium]
MSAAGPISARREGSLILTACVLLPLAGAVWAGRDVAVLFRFPPPLEIPDYPRFSWIAAVLVIGVVGTIALPWIRRWGVLSQPRRAGPTRLDTPVGAPLHRFPLWGWAALAWIALWWWLAWTRQPWFAWGQRYTFTPLWLGLIAAVNALTWRRSGTCLLRRASSQVAALFAASAAFWWLFEWLNRFVRNWHYLGVVDVGAVEYALHTSVCFSTVLPAVASMREWLGSCESLQARLADGPAWRPLSRPGLAWWLMAAGATGLLLTGVWPVYFYAALWSAPLLLAVGVALWRGRPGWWTHIATGDWRDAGSWALAALMCGVFWELWNYHSLAKWIYTVPFVQRWPIFEMPLLGYTGYLPFGLECALAVTWLERATLSPVSPQKKS